MPLTKKELIARCKEILKVKNDPTKSKGVLRHRNDPTGIIRQILEYLEAETTVDTKPKAGPKEIPSTEKPSKPNLEPEG